ncbi:MAG TPA: hypothetical protein VE818_13935 [Nitrososphaeraceae archaeon]|nr:hypothetical protein [Nitrososphaeraceae archaeon]
MHTLQPALYSLCDSLVNADGTTTGQGEPVYLQFRQVLLQRGLQALE